tara:strand:- start:186 stop:713 length:528 start_codon:yes stop_codon:yes gene_type:complete
MLLAPGGSVRGEVTGSDRPYVAADLGLAIFGEAAHREYIARAFALAARGGLRWDGWGAYLQLESASWFAAEGSTGEELTGVINLGLGGEYLYADGFVRTALAAGPSMVVTGTELDDIGQVGFFFELRPAGLRWALADRICIGLDPLVLSLTAPVLEGIPLIELEYRTTVVGEFLF